MQTFKPTKQIDQARCGRDNLEQLKTGLYLLEIWWVNVKKIYE